MNKCIKFEIYKYILGNKSREKNHRGKLCRNKIQINVNIYKPIIKEKNNQQNEKLIDKLNNQGN